MITATIEKESISHLNFPVTEVLATPQGKFLRDSDLRQAMRLGNLEKYKVRIVFEDAEGIKRVHTTVWGLTEKCVILKGGVTIPINRVHRIRFY